MNRNPLSVMVSMIPGLYGPNQATDFLKRSQAGFPRFHDGDVELCLSREPEDPFVLHSVVLGLHSPFFKASLSERWSGQKNDTISSGPIKWRYQLRFDEDDEKSGVA